MTTFQIDCRSYGDAVETAARREQTGSLPLSPTIRGYLNVDGIVTFEFGSDLTPDSRPIVYREEWNFSKFDRESPIEDYDEAAFAELREYATSYVLDLLRFSLLFEAT